MVSRARRFAAPGVVLLLAFSPLSLFAAESAKASRPVDYDRDVRPILSDHCYACHGPDQEKRKAGLRLDEKELVFKAGKSGSTPVVAGDLEKSELIRRITSPDEDDRMPPAKFSKQLTSAQIDTLRRWVVEGAPWSGHWAYRKPERPAIPEVQNKTWPRNEIDKFILARLEKEGLKPSQEADKRTLARRVSLDLTGLPPTVAEVEDFLYDNSQEAYDKLVDRLLQSPHYGERMAQDWLDLARYSDSQGYHHDSHRDMWPWRDWVIKAFNNNEPFDQFTIEQLAGDLLPNPSRDQRIATGFQRNEMTTSEGGAMPEEYAVKYVVGRVDTAARVWLGTSLACAECHDHKYDPISQKEYYQFFAYFNTIAENGLDQELNPVPRLALDTPEQHARVERFTKEIAALEQAHQTLLDAPNAEQSAAQVKWENRMRTAGATSWTVIEPARFLSKSGATLTVQPDASLLASGANPTQDVYEVTFQTAAQGITGLRIEALRDDSLPKPRQRGRSDQGEFLLTRFQAEARSLHPEQAAPVETPRLGNWHSIGPFKASSAKEAFSKAFGPESDSDLAKTYQEGALKWVEQASWQDGQTHELTGENSATYLRRTIHAREARFVRLSIGSDDGVQVWLNGRKVLSKDVARGVGADQDLVTVRLAAGENRLLLKINNGQGPSGFYFKLLPDPVLEHTIEFAKAAAASAEKGFPIQGALDDNPKTGWTPLANEEGSGKQQAFFSAQDPFGFKEGTEIKVRLEFASERPHHALGRFRMAVSTADGLGEWVDLPENIRGVLLKQTDQVKSDEQMTLQRFYRQSFVAEVQDLAKLLESQRKAKQDFVNGITVTMVMQEMEKPRDTFFLVRGNFQQHGEKVTPGVPKAIFPMPAEYPANRLGLAKWMVHPDNPLVSRVTVNHFWQHYFGNGLVKTAEDFGSQGEWPSHPELLDWLAAEFVRSSWNIKALQRLIVTSATYRQAAALTVEASHRDPENRLLARFPRMRLDAEAIRDTALAVSGLLNPKLGGPSVYPYQPPGLWEAVAFEDTRKYVQSQGAENYRRGIYTYWRRSLPYPSLITFDAPTRETCTVKRPRTNTPLQALTLMNDPVYVEASRAFGQRIIREGGPTLESRLAYAFRTCLGRLPTKAEREVLERAYRTHFQHFESDRVGAAKLVHAGASEPDFNLDVCELAAWTMIGTTLLNLDETITKG